MQVDIIKIGTSQGIRIPAKILKELNRPTSFDLKITEKGLLLEPENKKPREGWDRAFKKMSINKDDKLLIDDSIDLDFKD